MLTLLYKVAYKLLDTMNPKTALSFARKQESKVNEIKGLKGREKEIALKYFYITSDSYIALTELNKQRHIDGLEGELRNLAEKYLEKWYFPSSVVKEVEAQERINWLIGNQKDEAINLLNK